MALAIAHSRGLDGLNAPPVTVEAHLASGLPSFTLVGLPDTEVKEARDRKSVTLNAQKFFEEHDRLNVDKKEKKKLEDMLEKEGKIEKDYYLDEVLNVSVDYVNLLRQHGIAFPKERTIQPKNSPFNFLFGR